MSVTARMPSRPTSSCAAVMFSGSSCTTARRCWEGSSTMDEIALTGLRVRGFHGVLASEREQGQDFLVDAVLTVDTRGAAASDDPAKTVAYGVLAPRLAEVVAGEPVDLIETLACRLAEVCLA